MSVTPNIRNCCDLATSKCLRIPTCSYFCLQQRLCHCTDDSVSYEDVNGGKGGTLSDYDGAKLSFKECSGCCSPNIAKKGQTVTVNKRDGGADEAWTILKVEAGKITLTDGQGAYLVLNGINGHLCSVFYDSSAADACAICPEVRFDIVRSSATGTCKKTTCGCSCSC